MNEINSQEESRSYRFLLPGLSITLIVIIILKLIIEYYDEANEYYQGEPIVNLNVKLLGSIEYFSDNEYREEHFLIKTSQHECEFRITGGLFSIIKEKETLFEIQSGDSLQLFIYKNESNNLNKPNSTLKVIGIKTANINISPEEVKMADLSILKYNFSIGITIIFLVGAGLLYRKYKSL